MEDFCSPISLGCFYQEQGVEELRHSLLHTTIELETTLVSAKEEITKREYELIHLKDLLCKAEKERDEAQDNCKKLLQEKQILIKQLDQMEQQQKQKQYSHQEAAVIVNNEGESNGSNTNKNSASPECKDSIIINSPNIDRMPQSPSSSALPELVFKLVANRALPEKGKLLQAVMEAGPLLKTLLLAGPLPQWQHPPPQLDSTEIPPVAISPVSLSPKLVHQDSFSCINIDMSNCVAKKRTMVLASNGCDSSSPRNKCLKVVLP